MAAKKIYTSPNGVKVYRDAEWDEYYVVMAGKTKADATTYFTDDKQDAIDTANTLDKGI